MLMSNVTCVQIFNFGDTNAGLVVETQVQQLVGSSFTILSDWSATGLVEEGSGQYEHIFTLPAPFTGKVKARLQAQPGIVDTYGVNLPADIALNQAALLAAIAALQASVNALPVNFPFQVTTQAVLDFEVSNVPNTELIFEVAGA